ncbi:hypothetical protein Dimus_013988, partial [Dionaea muscipula]
LENGGLGGGAESLVSAGGSWLVSGGGCLAGGGSVLDLARRSTVCAWAADSAAVELPFSLGCGSVLRGGRRRLEVARGGG